MLMDKQNQLSNAQAVLGAALFSTNVIDLGPNSWAGNSVGDRAAPEIHFSIDTTFLSGTSLKIELVSADNEAMNSGLVVHEASDALLLAELTAGSRVRFMPNIPLQAKRYFGVRYTPTGTFTAGAISANAVTARQTNR